jgi:hypothetical protein
MLFKPVLLPVSLALVCFAATPLMSAFAASDNTTTPGKHDTAKGAAVGALAGHEVGHGHALAGAAVGAAIGHHEKTKAQEQAAGANKG